METILGITGYITNDTISGFAHGRHFQHDSLMGKCWKMRQYPATASMLMPLATGRWRKHCWHETCSFFWTWLVGGIPTPLKNMSSSLGLWNSHIYIYTYVYIYIYGQIKFHGSKPPTRFNKSCAVQLCDSRWPSSSIPWGFGWPSC